jgi:hypothetical protein
MIRPVRCHTDGSRGYQQALDDFGITKLLAKLSNYSKVDKSARINLGREELESVAAILITQFTESINGQLIAKYLHTIRHGHRDIIPGCIKPKFQAQSIHLPTCFPDKVKAPHFVYGDKLRWRFPGSNTEWGIVIGRFYNFASHRCCWMWCYLIWLSKDSPSAAWIVADTAWEDDLEPFE